MPRLELPSLVRNMRAMRCPRPVFTKPWAMKNAATMSQIDELPRPANASLDALIAPVSMEAVRPMMATAAVGSGCRTSATIVATKMPSICMPRASTPSGTGRK
jgi:hypothetical protein